MLYFPEWCKQINMVNIYFEITVEEINAIHELNEYY